MRRLAERIVKRFDEFVFWCNGTGKRTMMSTLIYLTLLIGSLIICPIWRWIYFTATALLILGLILGDINDWRLEKAKPRG